MKLLSNFCNCIVIRLIIIISSIIVLFECDKNPTQVVHPELILTIEGNKVFKINEQAKVSAIVKDAGIRDVRYVWYVDGNPADTTLEFSRYFTWDYPDTGIHRIIIQAFDIHAVKSQPDTHAILVTCRFPEIRINQNDTTLYNGDSITIFPYTYDTDGRVVGLQWKVDNDKNWYGGPVAARSFTWNRLQDGIHIVNIRAIDNDSLFSSAVTLIVRAVTLPGIVKIVENDTTLSLHDTIVLHAKTTGFKRGIAEYIWNIEGKKMLADTAGQIKVTFGLKDTGIHIITLFAVDNDSFITNKDTIRITVPVYHPETSFITNDTSLCVWEPLLLRASTADSLNKVRYYSFYVDGKPISESGRADTVVKIFTVADSGLHVITVFSIDKDSVQSLGDTILVLINPGYPSVMLPKDTTISSLDTILLKAQAQDQCGEIVSVVWRSKNNISLSGDSLQKVFYTGKSTVELVALVTDNDSLRASDTIVVTFNTPPVFKMIQSTCDTLFCTEASTIVHALYTYSLFDLEQDFAKVKSQVKNETGTVESENNHSEDSAIVRIDGPGLFFVAFTCTDAFGNVVRFTDTITVIQNHTICFAGHSIVCGMAGDGHNGGFRAQVLAGLRDSLLQYHNVKATGPITTPADMIDFPVDDSCFAISGSVAKEMHTMQRLAYKSMSADIWLLMLGANAGYTISELNYTIAIMDTMLARNPNARVYMLTSPPFPTDDYQWYTANYNLKYYYNKGIRDSVASRVSQGFHVSVIEAYSLLTKPDSTFDSKWFHDHVHPNIEGYKRLGEEILRVMKLDANRAIRKDLYRRQ